MTKDETFKIQRQLKAAGMKVEEDGIWGPETHDAYQAWLNANTPSTMPTPAPAAAKPWYLSRAVVGILVATAALVANFWGIEIDVEEATTLVVGIGGLVMALIGTVRRSAPIDPTLIAPGVRYPTGAAKVPTKRGADRPEGPFGH